MNPFDYINSITYGKTDIMVDDIAEKQYNSFIVNRGLSYFPDTVLYANEMNRYHHIDNRLKYSFLINIIRKQKRFSKWIKANESDDLSIIKQYYGYSNQKAKSVLSILTPQHITMLRERMNTGGLQSTTKKKRISSA